MFLIRFYSIINLLLKFVEIHLQNIVSKSKTIDKKKAGVLGDATPKGVSLTLTYSCLWNNNVIKLSN